MTQSWLPIGWWRGERSERKCCPQALRLCFMLCRHSTARINYLPGWFPGAIWAMRKASMIEVIGASACSPTCWHIVVEIAGNASFHNKVNGPNGTKPIKYQDSGVVLPRVVFVFFDGVGLSHCIECNLRIILWWTKEPAVLYNSASTIRREFGGAAWEFFRARLKKGVVHDRGDGRALI